MCTADMSRLLGPIDRDLLIADLRNLSLKSERVGVSHPSNEPTMIVWDLETTELIRRGVPFESMDASVLHAVKLNVAATEETHQPVVLERMTIWLGNGVTAEPFLKWLDEAHVHSAHNGLDFDMMVIKKYYTSLKRWFQHASKMFDTLIHLRARELPSPLTLASLLEANGGSKAAHGSQAPAMWRDPTRHDELLAYCVADVDGLAKLIAKRTIFLNSGRSTDAISISRLAAALRPLLGTCALVQGSKEWKEERDSRVTASIAPMLLGVSRFGNRQQAVDIVRGEPLPDPTQESKTRMRVGNEMENVARTLYENAHGVLVKQVGLVVHPFNSVIAASPDGILEPPYSSRRLLEIKVGMEKKPVLSDGYLVQLVVQMACTDAVSVDFMAVHARSLQFEVTRVCRDKNAERVVIKLLAQAAAEAQTETEALELDVFQQQELLTALRDMQFESVGTTVRHTPSFGGTYATSYVDEISRAAAKRPIADSEPSPAPSADAKRTRSSELEEYSEGGPFIAVVSSVRTPIGELGAVGVVAIRVDDFIASGWGAESQVFVGLQGGDGLQAKAVQEQLVFQAEARVAYNFVDELVVMEDNPNTRMRIDASITQMIQRGLYYEIMRPDKELGQIAVLNQVTADGLVSREEIDQMYAQFVEGDVDLGRKVVSHLENRLKAILALLKKASTVGIAFAADGRIADPNVFRVIKTGLETQVDNTEGYQRYLDNTAVTQQSEAQPMEDGRENSAPSLSLGGDSQRLDESESESESESEGTPEPFVPGAPPDDLIQDSGENRPNGSPSPPPPSLPPLDNLSQDSGENRPNGSQSPAAAMETEVPSGGEQSGALEPMAEVTAESKFPSAPPDNLSQDSGENRPNGSQSTDTAAMEPSGEGQSGALDPMAEDTTDVRGKDPPLPEDPSMPRIVGRSSECDDTGGAGELHYFLVLYPAKRKERTFKWKRLADVQKNRPLLKAFDRLPLQRQGSDPKGDGWVINVDDASGEGDRRVYRTWWFVWGEGNEAPLKFLREQRLKSDFVNREIADAYDKKLAEQQRRNAGLEEEDDDDKVMASALPSFLLATQMSSGPDRTASAPSSFRWDPSSGRPRLSLRAAVRNHTPTQDWTLEALTEYTLNRIFVLKSRVPPASGSPDAPTSDELEQMGKDLFYVRGSKLKAKWARARAEAARRRRPQTDEEEEEEEEEDEEEFEDDGDDDGDEGDDDGDDDGDGEGGDDGDGEGGDDGDGEGGDADQAAYNAWKKETVEGLRGEAVARWAASRAAVDNELGELNHQLEALQIIAAAGPLADRRVVADTAATAGSHQRVTAILARWRDEEATGEWMSEFSNPRLKLPDIRDYLSKNRSADTKAWLKLQREMHSIASQTERATEVMGSSYGQEWPFTRIPNATEAPGDHVVPVEWFSPGTELFLETRSPTQNPVNITISLLPENSEKGSNPIGLFSIPTEAKGKGIYSPDLVSDEKKALLAKKTACMFLSYPSLSNKISSKGSASMSRSSGVELYARAFELNPGFRELLNRPATKWERRIQLLNLAMPWQVGNPLVLYEKIFNADLEILLVRRFKGEDRLLKLCDEAVANSVLLAPR